MDRRLINAQKDGRSLGSLEWVFLTSSRLKCWLATHAVSFSKLSVKGYKGASFLAALSGGRRRIQDGSARRPQTRGTFFFNVFKTIDNLFLS